MRRTARDYTVGWICAIPIELSASLEMLDERHDDNVVPLYGNITSKFEFGEIGNHNVVMACLPRAEYGEVSAAIVVAEMKQCFPHLEYGLMVGVGGGVPSSTKDIRLGDIAVGMPNATCSGVIQYRQGKVEVGTAGEPVFIQTGSFDAAPRILRSAISSLDVDPEGLMKRIGETAIQLGQKLKRHHYPGRDADRLFKSDALHDQLEFRTQGVDCECCELVKRDPRENDYPVIHYGTIGSADQVVKNGASRDKWGKEFGIICFEMEAAGIVNQLPSLVIRGICDYSDNRKNKDWQGYAATTAAVFAKEVLSKTPVTTKGQYSQRLPDIENLRLAQNIHTGAKSERTERENKSLQALISSSNGKDPGSQRIRIRQKKDKPVPNSSEWILSDAAFQLWYTDNEKRALRIVGDAGKGKTMIMLSLIDELGQRMRVLSQEGGSTALSFYFCQRDDSHCNSGLSVLKGLLYELLTQNGQLTKYLQRRYESSGEGLFENFYGIWRLFDDILADETISEFYFVVDALDECEQGRDELLEFITAPSKVKWLVSSRNVNSIDSEFVEEETRLNISLEHSQYQVIETINQYVEIKVAELAKKKRYKKETKDKVGNFLRENAGATFLWVELICRELERQMSWKINDVLERPPKGLDSVYELMLRSIKSDLEDNEEGLELCYRVIATAMLALRPLHLRELAAVACLPTEALWEIQQIVTDCHSIFSIQKDILEFVHLSAKQYLENHVSDIFADGLTIDHRDIFKNCLIYIGHLQPNICRLRSQSATLNSMEKERQNEILPLEYPCCYWFHHLKCAFEKDPTIFSDVAWSMETFFGENLLHWIEALSLLGKFSEGITMMNSLRVLSELDDLPAIDALEMSDWAQDAERFLTFNRKMLETAPLQVYSSALIFAPDNSRIKARYLKQVPKWINLKPKAHKLGDACLHILEGHAASISSVAISGGGTVASGSSEGEIFIWDQTTGHRHVLTVGDVGVLTLRYMANEQKLVSAHHDGTLRTWGIETRTCDSLLQCHSSPTTAVAFSADGSRVAFGSQDRTVKVWEVATRRCIDIFPTRHSITFLAFSPNGQELLSGRTSVIPIWRIGSSSYEDGITSPTYGITSVAFSSHGFLACAVEDSTISIWDFPSRRCLRIIDTGDRVSYLSFAPKGGMLAFGLWNHTVQLYDIEYSNYKTGRALYHEGRVNTISFSPKSNRIVSGSADGIVKLWDSTRWSYLPSSRSPDPVEAISISPTGDMVAWASALKLVVWRIPPKLGPTKHHEIEFDWSDKELDTACMEISSDSRMVATSSMSGHVFLWIISEEDTINEYATFFEHRAGTRGVVFSPDNTFVASCSHDCTVRLWDIATKQCKSILAHPGCVWSLAMSSDGRFLATACDDAIVRLWNLETKAQVSEYQGDQNTPRRVVMSPSGSLVAATAIGGRLRVWNVENRVCIFEGDLQESFRSVPAPIYFSKDETRIGNGFESFLLPAPTQLLEQKQMDNTKKERPFILFNNEWVYISSQQLICVPFAYRSAKFAILEDMIAVACPSDQKYIIRFDFDHLPL